MFKKILVIYFLSLAMFCCPTLALAAICECNYADPTGTEGGSKTRLTCDDKCKKDQCADPLVSNCKKVADTAPVEPVAGNEGFNINDYKPTVSVTDFGGIKINFDNVQTCDGGKYYCIGWIGQYILALYRYGVGLAAILAVIVMMTGGFLWLTSGGSPDRLGKGKELIFGAFSGLTIALFSYIILYTISPLLVEMKPLKVLKIESIDPFAQFGGEQDYKNEQSSNSGGSKSTNELSPECKKIADNIRETYGNNVTDTYRPGERRHGSRDVFDMHLQEGDRLWDYVMTGTQLTGNDDPTWGTAYRMPDGTVFVDEPGGSNRHWHVECDTADHDFIPNM